MGQCFSSKQRKVSGSSSNQKENHHHNHQNHQQQQHHKSAAQKKEKEKKEKEKEKVNSNGGIAPLGKRTNFGYQRDFESKYQIGKLLGHGQFGYTYVATDRATNERVAVKRIEKKKMVLPIAVEDVKREVRILQALTGHENVVQFYNAFEDDDFVYIVMELCEGGELLDRILAKKDSRYSEKDAAKVVRQMLKVAGRCHLYGVVHRDMKPENFLFKSTKEDSPLKATDFGLSDFIKPGKKFQDIVGSAYYVAPEVLKRKSGPESDVWSIGVITYILLCGRRPFWDKTEDGIFKEVLRKKPEFREKPWEKISNSAKDFVKKLLVKDPRARLTAAQALSHPWVREGGEASEIPLDISVLCQMRDFVKYSRLKQFALRALASTLAQEELAGLRDQFDAIDIDKSGSITLEEIRQALAKDRPWTLKESRVLEILQACPILAGKLKSSDLEPSLAGHYGIPTTSTTLAFDSIQCILAIASRDGRIKLFGADEAQVLLVSPNPSSCKFLQFLENQGILLNLTSRNDIEVWDVDKKELAHVYSCKEITAFTVLQGSPFMYIGDVKGNVSVLQFDPELKQISCMQYSIPISITHGVVAEGRRDNSVVRILPQPLYEFSRVLVIFKNGLVILWGIQESQILAVCGNVEVQLKKNVTVAYQEESQTSNPLENRDNEECKQISSACWACSDGSRIAIGYTDGDIWLWSVPTMSKLKYNFDAKCLESRDSQCSPICKVQLSNRKAKVPIFSLKWHPGSNSWGCLYVYGGVDFDSSHMIRVIHLQESGITTNQNNLRELELVLPGPFMDMSILSNKHSKSKVGGESLLILTKTGQLSTYDIREIEKQLLDGKCMPSLSQLRAFMVKSAFADSSVTAAKLVTIPNDIVSSNALAQLHRSSKQFFPSTFRWPALGKNSIDTEGSVTIRSVYITGHSNGTINVWDASSPRMLLMLTIQAQSDVEATVKGCPVTAVDFCAVSSLLAIGDQLGRVQIYKIVPKHQEVKVPLNKGSTLQEKSVEPTADIVKVGILKVHKAAICCISVDVSSKHVAAGCEEGSVSLIDTKSCTLLSFKGYFSGISSSVTSLQFENSVFPGSGRSVLFVAARDASLIAIDGDTGHSLSPSIVKPKQTSTAIFMHALGPSIDTRVGSSDEKSSLPKQLNPHEENDTSHTDETQPLLLLCSENCLWLYSASAITQGTKKVYLKEKFETTCSWASAFQSSNYGFGLFLLFTTGKIEIRSLPDLSVLKETTLSRCSSCDLKPSIGLINSLSCSSDGRLVMIDGDQELFLVSLLNEDNDFRLSGSKVQVYNKEIQISPDHPVAHIPRPTKKKSLVKSIIKVKVSKSKNSSEDEDKQAATALTASELCSIFSTRNFPTSAASLDEEPISDIDDRELDIDDLDIEDHDENSKYHHSGNTHNRSLVSKFRRKLKGIKRSKGIQSTNTPIKGNGKEDITRIRTIEDIKSAYGHSQLKEPKVHELAKEKLLENQIKLQGINQRTAQMEQGAENFQSMAEELLKIVKEKKG